MARADWSTFMGAPGRLQRKYKWIFVILLVILLVQLLLGYHSSSLDAQTHDKSANSGRSAFSLLSGGSFPIDDDDNTHNQHQHLRKEDIKSPKQTYHRDTVKRHLSDLPFKPRCDVQSRDALSAITRAKSEECKRQIVETVCAIESGTFYAKQLTSRCPKGNYTRGHHLGCFQDEQTDRLLSGYYVNNKETNSPNKCIEICLQSGFMYAGVQYGNECFCGNSPPPSTVQMTDSSGKCGMTCPGEEQALCGGYFTMNVYETGISSESGEDL